MSAYPFGFLSSLRGISFPRHIFLFVWVSCDVSANPLLPAVGAAIAGNPALILGGSATPPSSKKSTFKFGISQRLYANQLTPPSSHRPVYAQNYIYVVLPPKTFNFGLNFIPAGAGDSLYIGAVLMKAATPTQVLLSYPLTNPHGSPTAYDNFNQAELIGPIPKITDAVYNEIMFSGVLSGPDAIPAVGQQSVVQKAFIGGIVPAIDPNGSPTTVVSSRTILSYKPATKLRAASLTGATTFF